MVSREVWSGPSEVLEPAFLRLVFSGFVTVRYGQPILFPLPKVLLRGAPTDIVADVAMAAVSADGRLVVDASGGVDVSRLAAYGFRHRSFGFDSAADLKESARVLSSSEPEDEMLRRVLALPPGDRGRWLGLLAWGVGPGEALPLLGGAGVPDSPWALWGELLDCTSASELGGKAMMVRQSAFEALLLWLSSSGGVDAELVAVCWRLARSDVPAAVVLLVSSVMVARG